MRLVGAGLGIIWLGSMAGIALAEEPAPLSAAGAEIRQLEKDQRRTEAARESTKAGVGNAPALSIDPAQDSPEAWLAEQKKKEREEQRRGTSRREKQRDWLVEGVESLKQSEPTAQSPAVAKPSESSDALSANKTDQSDPNSLLKLFAEQKKETSTGKPSAKPERGPDPFAPFLQSWLGNSPVRGQFFDQFATGSGPSTSGSAGAPSSSALAGSPALNANPLADVQPTIKAAATNPYLETAPVLPLAMPVPVSSGAPLSQPMSVPTLRSEGVPTPGLPRTDDSAPASKPPHLPASDDRKYFPQAKKF